MNRCAVTIASALLLTGCGQKAPAPAPAAGVEYGLYRATLVVPGGDLPFGLELAREGETDVAYLVNGPERVRVDEVAISGDSVSFSLASLKSEKIR